MDRAVPDPYAAPPAAAGDDDAHAGAVGGGAAASAGQTPAERRLAELIVSALQLEVAAADIAPEAPLFGEGLGLDSIDALEMALAISRAYGVELRSDDQRNRRIYASLRSLSAHVEAARGAAGAAAAAAAAAPVPSP